MEFLLSSFFIFSTISSSLNSTSAPPLLSLSCNPSNQTNPYHPIKTLLDNLTIETPTLNITLKQGYHYSGLMQCRPELGPKNCTLCANTARKTILDLCRNSTAVSAWFDGCYVQISSSDNAYTSIDNHSCSGRVHHQDPARYVTALGTLFLKLRADVNVFSHHGFSHGQISYENSNRSESKIYALVECVRSLLPRECDSCIEKAIEEVLFYCSGTKGGTLVHGQCLVRFDSSSFYYGKVDSGGKTGNFIYQEGENGGSKKKLVMEYWGGGFACFLVVVLFVWLLRRAILNRAKVGTSGSVNFVAAVKTAD